MNPEETPSTSNVRAPADEASRHQSELFSGDAFASRTARFRAPARKPQPARKPEPGLDETIREVLDRELKAPPVPEPPSEAGWLPARMLNEYVYCPRLFFYEHIDGIFVHNADTERGKDIHTRVDKGSGNLPSPAPADGETPEAANPEGEIIHSRSVQMGSARLGVTAKLDLVESSGAGGEVSPVDYKAGSPREGAEAHELWPADRMQLGLQMLIL
ncbi:MAG TPA: hypothetical protein VIS74_08345, partial [Chthoniobacterales bacterium]